MSYSFDMMAYALETLNGDEEIKMGLSHMIQALHDISHNQNDALNHDRSVRSNASLLQKRMKFLMDTTNEDA